MHEKLVALAVAAGLSLAVTRPARASAYGGSPSEDRAVALALLGTFVVLGVDSGLFLWDAGSLVVGHKPSVPYAVVELSLAAPQLAIGGYALVRQLQQHRDVTGPLVFDLWTGLLTAHAIWTLATQPGAPREEGPGRGPPPPAPEAARRLRAPGRPFVALGPTTVPLGPLAQTGLGLVGRF